LLAPAVAAAPPPEAGEDVLATVDGAPAVTVADVLYYYRNHEAETAPVAADDVAELVEDLAAAKVLLLEAEGKGYGDIPVVIDRCEKYRRASLRDAAYKAFEADAPASEEELRAFYEMDTKWRKYADIRCKNREEAEAARAELAAGRPWEEVLARYSIEENAVERGGANDIPMAYDGREASRAVFATPVGGYTAAVPDNDGIRWHVFRVDKIVHGRTDTFEEALPGLSVVVPSLKAVLWFEQQLVPELRREIKIARDEEMWASLQRDPFLTFAQTWGRPGVVIGDAGGVPCEGEQLVNLIDSFFMKGPDGLDAYRARDPADFAYVTDLILNKMEIEALAIYEAQRRGLDRRPDFIRGQQNYRADLVTSIFVDREFTSALPPLDYEAVQKYFDAHPEQFRTPERVEIYAVIMPDREKLQAFYDDIRAGADLVMTGEAYHHARGLKLMESYEPPPKIPPEQEEWFGVVAITKDPDPAEPDGPYAAELRPRAFPFTRLKELSEIFRLSDGRWAFFAPIFYRPFNQESLDDAGTGEKCDRLAWAEYIAGPEVERRAQEWLDSLRAKHDLVLYPERFAAAAASANSAE
jgi:hypothetical protein